MKSEGAHDQRNRFPGDLGVLLPRPETLDVKFLERPAREFKPVLAGFGNFVRRVHWVEISPFVGREPVGNAQTQRLESAVRLLKWKANGSICSRSAPA